MSESEEMYLITIAQLVESGLEGPIPLSRLAEELAIVPVSANQMVKKLEEAGLVEYLPYKGVRLTGAGLDVARQVLRHRRLWEFFLVKHLELPITDADAMACRLEHITSTEVAERLNQFLGEPQMSPQGKPIPSLKGEIPRDSALILTEANAGDRVRVSHIDAEPDIHAYFTSEWIRPGATITVLAKGSDGSLLIEAPKGRVSLDSTMAACVNVHRLEASV